MKKTPCIYRPKHAIMGDTKTYSRVELRNGGRTKRVSEVRSFAVLAHLLAILRSWQQRAGCLIKAGRLAHCDQLVITHCWRDDHRRTRWALRLITGADDDHRLAPSLAPTQP